LAEEIAAQVRGSLEAAGFSLAGPKGLVSSGDQARQAARDLAADPPDLLLVLQATFADSSMVTKLAQEVDAPLVMWAVPEDRTGGRLRLNSFCGLNLAAHALKRAGHDYDYVYAAPDDHTALEHVAKLAAAGRVRRLLRGARVGRVGENPEGLDSCTFDADGLRGVLGPEVVQVGLAGVFSDARAVDPRDVDTVYGKLLERLDQLEQMEQDSVRRTLAVYLALRRLASQDCLDGLAVRCWPEFFTELGCAACGAMSLLSDELRPCSCEADVNGTISQLILQWLSGEPSFGTDLVSVDAEKDEVVLWHCGLAPLSMADTEVRPRATIHSNRNLPLLMEFPLKPGRVTVARLSEATGTYRLIVGSGEMLRAPMSFSGTSGVLRFDRPAAEVLDVILREGVEHHLSLTYGDHLPALLALAKMLNLPVLRL
jgi:L-fucose isomerase-like protein